MSLVTRSFVYLVYLNAFGHPSGENSWKHWSGVQEKDIICN